MESARNKGDFLIEDDDNSAYQEMESARNAAACLRNAKEIQLTKKWNQPATKIDKDIAIVVIQLTKKWNQPATQRQSRNRKLGIQLTKKWNQPATLNMDKANHPEIQLTKKWNQPATHTSYG